MQKTVGVSWQQENVKTENVTKDTEHFVTTSQKKKDVTKKKVANMYIEN